jgi:hypothetical protein
MTIDALLNDIERALAHKQVVVTTSVDGLPARPDSRH